MNGHQRPGSGRILIAMASRPTLNLVFPGQYAEAESGTHYPRYCDSQTAAPPS